MRVRLVIPDGLKPDPKNVESYAAVHGAHFAYDGKPGTVICGAGNGGAYVAFDGMHAYIGCPVAWLEPIAIMYNA